MKLINMIIIVTALTIISCNKDADAIEGDMTATEDSVKTEKIIQQLTGNNAASEAGTEAESSSGGVPECSCNYGKMSWEDWKEKSTWAEIVADGYDYNENAIEEISDNYSDDELQIYVFGGMWSPDSELFIPLIFEILEKAGIDQDEEVELYSVDEDMAEPTHTTSQLRVYKVPTVIVMKNDIELGRVAELPRQSWEEDIAGIISEK